MKIIKLYILVAPLLLAMNAIGQTAGKHFSMTVLVKKNTVSLRWFPNSHKDWLLGKSKGYQVYRKSVGKPDSVFTVNLSKGLIKPMDPVKMEAFFKGYNPGILAARISQKAPDSTDIESNDLYMAMAMQASAMSPLISQTLGLIFVDSTALAGAVYEYTLEMPGIEKLTQIVNIAEQTVFVAPDSLSATYSSGVSTLKWRMSDSLMQMGYVVERSDDNARTFKELNTSPIMVEDKPNALGHYYSLYIDTLQVGYKQYYYRIRALTPFGIRSLASEMIGVYSYRDQVPAPLVSGRNIKAGNLLTWTYPDSLLSDIQGFKVYRSEGIGKTYTIITDTLLPSTTLHWLDNKPLNNSYYRVAAIDWGSDPHVTYPVFVQVDDSIPPMQPKVTSVMMLEKNRVLIQWSRNTEQDFRGYSVYKANNLNDDFALLSKQMKADTFLLDTLATGLLNPHIYYYVVAYDNRLNMSKGQDTLKINRPDVIPPAMPLIKQYDITDSTVVLQLVASPSEDVAYHVLWRTDTKAQKIDTLAYFNDGNLTYTDTTALPRTSYKYEWIAYDRSGLRNTDSSSIVVALFDQGSLPPIRDLGLNVIEEGKKLRLTWSYPIPVKQYILYRAKGSTEPLTEFKYLASTFKEYIESSLQENTEYRYALMALFKDGTNTRISKTMSHQTPTAQP